MIRYLGENKVKYQIREEDVGIELSIESKYSEGLQVFKISISPLPVYIIIFSLSEGRLLIFVLKA